MSREVQPWASDLTATSSLCAQANNSFLYARGLHPCTPGILNKVLHKGIVAGRGHACQWGQPVPGKASRRNSWERSRNRGDTSPASMPCPQAQGPSPQEVTPLLLIPQHGEALRSHSQVTGGASQSWWGTQLSLFRPLALEVLGSTCQPTCWCPPLRIFHLISPPGLAINRSELQAASWPQRAGLLPPLGSAAQESYLNPSRPSPRSWGRGGGGGRGRNQNNSCSQRHKGRAIHLCRASDCRACSLPVTPPGRTLSPEAAALVGSGPRGLPTHYVSGR